MTPTQRRELERLIDDARYAMLDRGLTAMREEAVAERAVERVSETNRAVMSYLDEATDYSAAEAVIGS